MRDPVDLDALDALLAAATPGPWGLGGEDECRIYSESEWVGIATVSPEAKLIVAAVNALPGLIVEVRALREVVEEARTLMGEPWYSRSVLPHECDHPETCRPTRLRAALARYDAEAPQP